MQPIPTPPPRRKRVLLVIAIAAVVAAAAVTTVVVLVRDSPAKAVERYLTALLDRDIEAAFAEVVPDRLPESEELSVFLVEDAMRTDWSFEVIETGGELAGGGRTVRVDFTGLGQSKGASFATEESGDGWQVATPFSWITFERSSLTYLDVDGIRLVDPSPQILSPRPLYPVFPGTHRFFASLPEGVTASNAEALEGLSTPEPKPVLGEDHPGPIPELVVEGELLDQAGEQIAAIIDACAATGDPGPRLAGDVASFEGFCPFAFRTAYEYEDGSSMYLDSRNVEWTVDPYPQFTLADPPGLSPEHEAGSAGVEAVVEQEGAFRVTGEVVEYSTVSSSGEYQRLAFDCEFAPDGFRGVIDENDAITMVFLTTDLETSAHLTAELDNERCTHTFEAL
ncbi:hypothetical protein AB0B28_21120 [Glycomyces sp. NPDC046736]|uniref:hypothetical protein n=1 Tax=Glycomyces sp. NPDC046736 TaxID=3155615 RepID=UPI00340373E4